MPKFVIVMGGAGSGKNYFISKDPVLSKYTMIDVDEIKKNDPNNFVHVMKRMLHNAMEAGVDIVHPTIGGTVLGNTNKLDKAREMGYDTEVVFIDNSPRQGIENVGKRAAGGGHAVPDEKIVLTYQRAKDAFPQIAAHADTSRTIKTNVEARSPTQYVDGMPVGLTSLKALSVLHRTRNSINSFLRRGGSLNQSKGQELCDRYNDYKDWLKDTDRQSWIDFCKVYGSDIDHDGWDLFA